METLILLIVIGAISAIFNKGKPRNQRVRQPAFGDVRPLPGKPVPPQVKTNLKPPDLQENLEKKYNEVKIKAEVPAATIPFSSVPIGEENKVRPAAAMKKPAVKQPPAADRLIEGIIWSEILGPPRSKKPYSAGKGR